MPHALIMTAAGINCDRELAEAFELAGATTEPVHLNRLMAEPALVDRFDLVGLPGGFSFGDAVAAGRIVAQMIRRTLYPALVRAVERGVPMIAPCNGFQIAVQAGLLPGPERGGAWPATPAVASVTLARNESARFVDRWVSIEIPAETVCVWTRGIDLEPSTALLPVAHGEGRFIPGSGDGVERLEAAGQVAVRYAADDNPNGSVAGVAGICDASGLVFGLMPHPERYTRWTQHPWWSRLPASERTGDPPGLVMFRKAVAHAGGPATADGRSDERADGPIAASCA